MLSKLQIKNYALIEQLDIDFCNGFTTITGETGAGKSILLGALGLILGNRADIYTLHNKTTKCIVEAYFNISEYNLESFFADNEIEYSTTCIIRREILPSAISRAFINDTPANLVLLKEITSKLIDIHSQYQTLQLNQESYQLNIVDAFAQNNEQIIKLKSTYTQYKSAQMLLDNLITSQYQLQKEVDYLQFQFNELTKQSLESIDVDALEQSLLALNSAEEIKQAFNGVAYLFTETEHAIINQVLQAKKAVSVFSKSNTAIENLEKRLQGVYVELKDLHVEIEQIAENTQYDPQQIQIASDTLDFVYKLFKKNGVNSVKDLVVLRNEIDQKLQNYQGGEEQIEKQKSVVSNSFVLLQKSAKEIHVSRIGAKEKLAKEIVNQLHVLGMETAIFDIDIKETEQYSITGNSQLKMCFTANKGTPLREIRKTASGGELSRIMLSIKNSLSNKVNLPTILFDEIDAGVSGNVASQMAKIMESMAITRQVIAITHLPQIACKGEEHFFVYKNHDKEQTLSEIKKLNKPQRIEEIAKMLSSNNPTNAAIKNAEELLFGK